MKKLLISINIILFSFFYYNITFANYVDVIVTEEIPGLGCEKIEGTYNKNTGGYNYTTDSKTGESYENAIMYKCQVEEGAQSVIKMIGIIIKYFTYIVSLVGVLFVVYNGILYSMGGLDGGSSKKEAKDRIVYTIIGLIILFLAGPLLQLIAPWVYE